MGRELEPPRTRCVCVFGFRSEAPWKLRGLRAPARLPSVSRQRLRLGLSLVLQQVSHQVRRHPRGPGCPEALVKKAPLGCEGHLPLWVAQAWWP